MVAASPGIPAGCNEPQAFRLAASGDPSLSRPGAAGPSRGEKFFATLGRWAGFAAQETCQQLFVSDRGQRELPSAARHEAAQPSGESSARVCQAWRFGAGLPVQATGQRRAQSQCVIPLPGPGVQRLKPLPAVRAGQDRAKRQTASIASKEIGSSRSLSAKVRMPTRDGGSPQTGEESA